MRSMIHASFTLGFAEYCEERDLPHPGVTVLDSPLVTYRQPETAAASVDNKDEYLSFDVAAAFYRYLDIEAPAQTVVIENTTPPAQLSDTAVVHHFTKQEGFRAVRFLPNPLIHRQRRALSRSKLPAGELVGGVHLSDDPRFAVVAADLVGFLGSFSHAVERFATTGNIVDL